MGARSILIIVWIISTSIISAQDIHLKINEFLASNIQTDRNSGYNQYSDWIEIYNAGENSIELDNFYLTDDPENPFKWKFPDNFSMTSKGYFFIWAVGKGEGSHTNFQLNKDGEFIGIFDSAGNVIDSISFSNQLTNISFGRYPDGSGDWFYFADPTPDEENKPGYSDYCKKPIHSLSSGFFAASQNLIINSETTDSKIYYTTDGSMPNENSLLYSGPISINQTSVIISKAFSENHIPSDETASTYFINETTELPVVSLITEPDNLFSDQTGIYVAGSNGISGYCTDKLRNWNQDWERKARVEYFDSDKTTGFTIDCGIKIGGGCTRLYPLKSLAIYAREEYGYSKINYQIFKDKNIREFNNFNLRNGGQDFYRAIFRDGMMQTIVKDKIDIDWQAYKPVLLFINGEYWGIHGMREKHNEHYLAANHGIDPDEVDILSNNAEVHNGSADIYNEMINFIERNNLSEAQNYETISDQIDISEYLNYVITEIYFANIDWPGGNIKYWREHGADNKWRWILFDTDLGFGAHGRGQYNSNTLADATSEFETYYANPPWATFLLRNLLKNEDFRNEFIQRFSVLMNTVFESSRVLGIIDSLKNKLAPEISRHTEKWEAAASFNGGWDENVKIVENFAQNRAVNVRTHVNNKFSLNGSALLTAEVNAKEMGKIEIAGINIGENYSGPQFKSIPIKIKAIPNPGYKFSHWSGDFPSLISEIEISISGETHLTAVFTKAEAADYSGIKINEFMASNSFVVQDETGDYDDWIELYNNSSAEINISNLFLTDDFSNPEKHLLNFSASKILIPGEFFLLWADGEIEEGENHLNFKLDAGGEQIGISIRIDSAYYFIDSISFGQQLTDVSFGRSEDGADSWSYFNNPTPRTANNPNAIDDNRESKITDFKLDQNYPNPFNPTTKIEYSLPGSSFVSLKVYDVLGNEIMTLVNEQKNAGHYEINFRGNSLSSGLYIYKIQAGTFFQARKMMLLK